MDCKSIRVRLLYPLVFVMALSILAASAQALKISDIPLDLQVETAPPNLVFIVDTSEIMDSEILVPGPNGLEDGFRYLFPTEAYHPAADHAGDSKQTLTEEERRRWMMHWHGHNRLFYNPFYEYRPWSSTQQHVFDDAHVSQPFSNPVQRTVRVTLGAVSFRTSCQQTPLAIPLAHYFTIWDANGNRRYDNGEAIYLVAWIGSNPNDLCGASRMYYRFEDDGDNLVENGELIPVFSEAEKDRVRPAWYDESGRLIRLKTDREDLQNFANWFSYYRRREFAVKAALSDVITHLHHIQVGLYASNGGMGLGVQPVKVDDTQSRGVSLDKSETVLNALYGLECSGSNALRESLDQVGRYFHQHAQSPLGPSPFWAPERAGGCQRAYAVIITGSYWNGVFTGLGNNALADIAEYYYQEDLAPDLEDFLSPMECNSAVHQHLTIYGVSFGVSGTMSLKDTAPLAGMNPDSYLFDPCTASEVARFRNWPEPVAGSPGTIDDLAHAAVGGHGLYAHVADVHALTSALERMAAHMERPLSCAAAAAGHSTAVCETSAYQTHYNSEDWSGDVVAYGLNMASEGQEVQKDGILWQADRQLRQTHNAWDSRKIVTFGGPWQTPQGIAFRYDYLSDVQRKMLGSDLIKDSEADQTAMQLLEYLRGRSHAGFRVRKSLLGDIVHSVPVVAQGLVFVGGNDGMLHAFDAAGGDETFAYIPGLVMPQLACLADKDYVDRHRFFVDGQLFAGEVMVDEFQRQMLLVGGLGKGGKGFYSIRIGSRKRKRQGHRMGDYETTFSISDAYSEHDAAKAVLWEYPAPDTRDPDPRTDQDIGCSFSQGYAVNANAPGDAFRPVVIFGNGYCSSSGHAVLYILDALEGRLIRKIDTGADGDNGLSTPALVDVNMDRCVDYAFAGDLKGNLWRFDLSSPDPGNWGVAYGEDQNGDGTLDAAHGDEPAPVFQTNGQPITGRPDVMRMRSICAAQAPGFLIVFGTGQYLSPEDRADRSLQAIYAIWDYGDDSDDSEHLGRLVDHTSGKLSSGLVLVRKTIVGESRSEGRVVREVSDEEFEYVLMDDNADEDGCSANNRDPKREPNPHKFAGWFLEFPAPPDPLACRGERVVSNALIRGGSIIVHSFAPVDEPCRTGGLSWVYCLKGCSGNPITDLEGEPVLPWRHGSRIQNIVVFKSEKQTLQDQLMIIDQKGIISSQDILGEKWGRVYWRQN